MEKINRKQVVKLLKEHGWIKTELGNGSHEVWIEKNGNRITTLPYSKGSDIPTGTLAAIRLQAGINELR